MRAATPWIHILSDGRRHVAFCPETVGALAIDDRLRRGLEAYVQTGSLPLAAKTACIPTAKLERAVSQLVDPPARQPILADLEREAASDRDRRPPGGPGLDRLVLHVSNDCNLRCRYCYADGGAYGGPRGHMPREIAFAAVTWAVRSAGGVRRVQFFGGEPLLNPRLIMEVCEYPKVLHDEGEIGELPRFGVVTNGTLGDAAVVELLKRYNIGLTISIDGPEAAHDALRGRGSFNQADAFARLCLDDPAIRLDFECTWTPVHVEMGISPADCVEFFFERYGLRVLHVVPVAAPVGSPLHLPADVVVPAYEEAARHSVATLLRREFRANSLSYRALKKLHAREGSAQYCPAGSGTLAVGADGGLYPCFMFAGNESLRLWRFTAEAQIRDNRFGRVSSTLNACLKSSQKECPSCWASPLCSGCLGTDLIETGDIARRSGCDKIRAIAATILLEIASAGQDSLAAPGRQ